MRSRVEAQTSAKPHEVLFEDSSPVPTPRKLRAKMKLFFGEM